MRVLQPLVQLEHREQMETFLAFQLYHQQVVVAEVALDLQVVLTMEDLVVQVVEQGIKIQLIQELVINLQYHLLKETMVVLVQMLVVHQHMVAVAVVEQPLSELMELHHQQERVELEHQQKFQDHL